MQLPSKNTPAAAWLCAGLVAVAFIASPARAQLSITPTNNAQTLVNNLVGDGITIQNATYSGGQVVPPFWGGPTGEAAGTFKHGPQGIRDGVLITNGDALLALPPNYAPDSSGVLAPEMSLSFGGAERDDLCQRVIGEDGYDIFDPVRLTIDFTVKPGFDGLQIDYLFGSEEYPEYVGQIYADAFGFFVGARNASESTYTNIGLDLQGSPININGPFFRGGSVVEDGATTAYDGTTPRLTSTIRLSQGQNYRMIIVLCDAGDELLDSGVFLAALAGCQGECNGTYVCVEGKNDKACNEDGEGPQIPAGNVAPVPQNDNANATAGVALQVDVLANDHEPNGDAMKVRAVSIPSHGTATIIADRLVEYRAAASYNGSDAVQVQVCDPYGACAVSQLRLNVSGGTGVEPTDPTDPTDPTEPTHPTDPAPIVPTADDPDADGLGAAAEAAAGTDPTVRDTDGDGILDGAETTTDPLDADSDDDGLADGAELQFGTDPTKADSDGDGLGDGLEVGAIDAIDGGTSAGGYAFQGSDLDLFGRDEDPASRTDPMNPDSDGDGVLDGSEDTNKNGRVDSGERNPGLADGLVGPGSSSRPGCGAGDAGAPLGFAFIALAFVVSRRQRRGQSGGWSQTPSGGKR